MKAIQASRLDRPGFSFEELKHSKKSLWTPRGLWTDPVQDFTHIFFKSAVFYQSKWLWTWTVPFSLYNIKRDCWSVRPQLLECMPRAVYIVLGPQPQMDWPPGPQMDLSTDPQHLYLQRSALEASFPPAKADPCKTAATGDRGGTVMQRRKNTKKPHH